MNRDQHGVCTWRGPQTMIQPTTTTRAPREPCWGYTACDRVLQPSGLSAPSCIPAEVSVTGILIFGETQPSLGSVILATATALHKQDWPVDVLGLVEEGVIYDLLSTGLGSGRSTDDEGENVLTGDSKRWTLAFPT